MTPLTVFVAVLVPVMLMMGLPAHGAADRPCLILRCWRTLPRKQVEDRRILFLDRPTGALAGRTLLAASGRTDTSTLLVI